LTLSDVKGRGDSESGLSQTHDDLHRSVPYP